MSIDRFPAVRRHRCQTAIQRAPVGPAPRAAWLEAAVGAQVAPGGVMANLGFIGLGAMGSRIAERLQRAGHSMTVYDRNAKRVEALAAKGAAAARTPAEVAGRSEIVLSCVADDS